MLGSARYMALVLIFAGATISASHLGNKDIERSEVTKAQVPVYVGTWRISQARGDTHVEERLVLNSDGSAVRMKLVCEDERCHKVIVQDQLSGHYSIFGKGIRFQWEVKSYIFKDERGEYQAKHYDLSREESYRGLEFSKEKLSFKVVGENGRLSPVEMTRIK